MIASPNARPGSAARRPGLPQNGRRFVTVRLYRSLVLLLFIFVLTSTLQQWIGGLTVYSQAQRSIRTYIHDILVGKQFLPPGKSLNDVGAQGTDRRILIPRLAEYIANLFGGGHDRVLAAYYDIDWVSLFLSFLFFWLYLRRWFEPMTTLLGVTYLAFTFVTTYHGYYFHPWDRPLFFLWLLMAFFIRDGRTIPYLLTLFISLLTKFTAVIFPLLYALFHFEDFSGGRRRRFLTVMSVQIAIVFGSYYLLNRISGYGIDFPGYAGTFGEFIQRNWPLLLSEKLAHPAPLMFLCPLLLVPLRWRELDRFMRSSVVFALVFLAIHFVGSLFHETRAMTPALIFLLPPALTGAGGRGPGAKAPPSIGRS
jgi:hypothetical protein